MTALDRVLATVLSQRKAQVIVPPEFTRPRRGLRVNAVRAEHALREGHPVRAVDGDVGGDPVHTGIARVTSEIR